MAKQFSTDTFSLEYKLNYKCQESLLFFFREYRKSQNSANKFPQKAQHLSYCERYFHAIVYMNENNESFNGSYWNTKQMIFKESFTMGKWNVIVYVYHSVEHRNTGKQLNCIKKNLLKSNQNYWKCFNTGIYPKIL